jgi:tetratricopeptide (TPR) repeat protein
MMSSNKLELDDETYAEITRLCEEGDSLAGEAKYESAVAEYNKAWKLVPEPKNSWEASTWILAAIADACFLMGKGKSARQALEYAMTCPGAVGNPFLHLRLGQVLFDANEKDAAVDELMRAYMGAGAEIFEKDEPKYFEFLKTRATI